MISFLNIFAIIFQTNICRHYVKFFESATENDLQQLNHLVTETLSLIVFVNIHAVPHYTNPNLAHSGSKKEIENLGRTHLSILSGETSLGSFNPISPGGGGRIPPP